MPSQEQLERAAAVAAEKANGGRFADPIFYKPEHREFWKDVIRAAFEAAKADPPSKSSPTRQATGKEIRGFPGHCVYIRSVYSFMLRIWRDSSEDESDGASGPALL
jgi:hypothetical protein